MLYILATLYFIKQSSSTKGVYDISMMGLKAEVWVIPIISGRTLLNSLRNSSTSYVKYSI